VKAPAKVLQLTQWYRTEMGLAITFLEIAQEELAIAVTNDLGRVLTTFFSYNSCKGSC